MLVTKQFQFSLTSTVFLVYTMQVNGKQNCLVTNILHNIFFCVPQNSLTGLDWYEVQ